MSNSPQLTLHAFDSSSKTKKVDKETRLSTKQSSCSTIDVCLSVCLQRAQIWQRYTLKGKPKQNFVFFLLQRVEAERSGLNYCCQATAENKRASGDISKLNRSLRRKKKFQRNRQRQWQDDDGGVVWLPESDCKSCKCKQNNFLFPSQVHVWKENMENEWIAWQSGGVLSLLCFFFYLLFLLMVE